MNVVFIVSLVLLSVGLVVFVECDTGYRLPNEYEVIAYQLDLIPYLDTGDEKQFTMEGEVNIMIKPKYENLSTITLHSKNLTFIETTLIGETTQLPNVTFDDLHDFAVLHLESNLVKGETYYLTIKYEGKIQDSLHGFYKSSYEENNVTKWLATTHFEATHARKAFPCFDEPQYKATFELTVARRPHFSNTLSNMPIKYQAFSPSGDTVIDIFYPTPKMSTYLLAFIVSEYQSPNYVNISGKSFGVWSSPETGNKTKYAFDIGQRILEKMGEYTNIPYYDMADDIKMDLVDIPQFSAGAMENWGLITFAPNKLLSSDTEQDRFSMSSVIAHEIAHQWFGNLVTCHWWSDIWLNEGFANFFELELLKMIGVHLEKIDFAAFINMQFAFYADSAKESKPLTNPDVNSPEEIQAAFSPDITYAKGGSIVKMIKHLIGEDTFQKGLKYYLNDRMYDLATPEDLFAALNIASVEDGSMSRYGKITVGDVMETWTKNRGFPLVTVSIDRDTGDVTFTQEQFARKGDRPDDVLYKIPITYTTSRNFSFEDTKPDFILTTKSLTLPKLVLEDEYIILNKKATGFYRVNYDQYTWSLINEELMNNKSKIDKINKLQIVSDIRHLKEEGYNSWNSSKALKNYSSYEYLAETIVESIQLNNREVYSKQIFKIEFLDIFLQED